MSLALTLTMLTASVRADRAPLESDNRSLVVTLLGTGTPVPNPRQFGPSVLVEAGDVKLLFDCGRGCADRLWNLSPAHLRHTRHLFLTHMHSDHTVGTAYSENLIRGSADADVLVHEVMSPALEQFLRATYSKAIADDIVALHTLAPDVGRVFSKSRTRLGVLTHLDNDPARIPSLEREIRSTWDGDFVVGEDFMRIEIGPEIRVSMALD